MAKSQKTHDLAYILKAKYYKLKYFHYICGIKT